LVNPLVTSIYEDHHGIVWIASMGGLNRIDRRTGKNIVPAGAGVGGDEIIAILQDPSGDLLAGTFQGLQRLDQKTGELSRYARSSVVRLAVRRSSARCCISERPTTRSKKRRTAYR
jgi:ligand-binding sensor domain-containing protein